MTMKLTAVIVLVTIATLSVAVVTASNTTTSPLTPPHKLAAKGALHGPLCATKRCGNGPGIGRF